MLKLRRGIISQVDPLRVRVGAEERPAWADEGMVAESGLPAEHMGRGIGEDRLFFASVLAAGDALAATFRAGAAV